MRSASVTHGSSNALGADVDRLELAGWQVEIADAQKVKDWRRWPA